MKEVRDMAFVLSKDGEPLYPCSAATARVLLSKNEAKVMRVSPFVIKLKKETEEYKSEHTLTVGVDIGSKWIAFAVSDENGNCVYASQIELRDDIASRMERRKMYRRKRRYRCRYRESRFLNRGNSVKRGGVNPSMLSKIESFNREMELIKRYLPIGRVVFETAKFDPALMKRPELKDTKVAAWGYQQGFRYGYQNTRLAVLARDKYVCRVCKSKRTLQVHHIIPRSAGGTSTPENLITLCKDCHAKVHLGEIRLKCGRSMSLRAPTQTNEFSSQLKKIYPYAEITYGFITAENRWRLGYPKSTHWFDAVVIATGGKRFTLPRYVYHKKCIAKGDYRQTDGLRSEKRLERGKIMGFRKYDKVRYLGKEYFIKGRMERGYAVLMDFSSKKVDFSYMPKGQKTVKLVNLKRISARSSWMIIKEKTVLNAD